MDGPEREQELWQRVAAEQQPDEKRKQGMQAALERYYRAIGLLRAGRRDGGGDDPLGQINPIDGSRRLDGR
jgi:hypothetical protein